MNARVSECGPDVVCVSVADCCLVMENKLSKSALKGDGIHCKVFTGQHVVCRSLKEESNEFVHKGDETVSVNVSDITVCVSHREV